MDKITTCYNALYQNLPVGHLSPLSICRCRSIRDNRLPCATPANSIITYTAARNTNHGRHNPMMFHFSKFPQVLRADGALAACSLQGWSWLWLKCIIVRRRSPVTRRVGHGPEPHQTPTEDGMLPTNAMNTDDCQELQPLLIVLPITFSNHVFWPLLKRITSIQTLMASLLWNIFYTQIMTCRI